MKTISNHHLKKSSQNITDYYKHFKKARENKGWNIIYNNNLNENTNLTTSISNNYC